MVVSTLWKCADVMVLQKPGKVLQELQADLSPPKLVCREGDTEETPEASGGATAQHR